MKLIYCVAALLLCGVLAHGGEIQLRDGLERKYLEQAVALRAKLEAALRDEDTTKSILSPLWKSNRTMEEAQDAMCKACRVAKHSAVREIDEQKLCVVQFSESPPFLREDPNDLYNRYRSAIQISLFSYDKDGNQICASDHPYDVTIPVAADLEGKWHFPNIWETVELVKLRILQTAKGRLEIAEEDSRLAADCKRLTIKR
jgi:hypothetical protein